MWELPPRVLKLVESNNARVRRLDGDRVNPYPLDDLDWYQEVVAAHPRIRAEWDAFAAAGGNLPLVEEVLGVPDQNEDSYWKMAAFVILRRPVPELAAVFPETTEALRKIPGLRSACWSVLGPGGWLPTHVGENAGCLRFLLCVDAAGASVTVGGTTTMCVDGEGILFDDTVPHATANPSDVDRVTILCDLIRPLPGTAHLANLFTQRTLHSLTPIYRKIEQRGTQRFVALNGDLTAGQARKAAGTR